MSRGESSVGIGLYHTCANSMERLEQDEWTNRTKRTKRTKSLDGSDSMIDT